jgi:hypothetical protein
VIKAKGSNCKKRTPKKKSPGKTRFNPPRSTTKSQRSCKKAWVMCAFGCDLIWGP